MADFYEMQREISDVIHGNRNDGKIECLECGERYLPITDEYRCPCCGESNYSDEEMP